MSDDGRKTPERRRHERNDNRAEMSLGSSRTWVSNLSLGGAYVSILAGLHPGDSFTFELALDGQEDRPVRGRAIVSWTDPGVGVGVRFDLAPAEHARLAEYLEQLRDDGEPGVELEEEANSWDVPRAARRTVALGSETGGDTRVWFKYLPPDEREE